VRSFGKGELYPPNGERSDEEIKKNEINLNDQLGLDDHTMCGEAFPEPCATCCFVNDNLLFVVLFYNPKRIHYHMLVDLGSGRVT